MDEYRCINMMQSEKVTYTILSIQQSVAHGEEGGGNVRRPPRRGVQVRRRRLPRGHAARPGQTTAVEGHTTVITHV